MSILINNSSLDSDLNKKIGAKIKALRTAHRLTQKELALGVGSQPQYIQKIETGVTNISVAMVQSIAHFFKVDIRCLLFEDNDLSSSEGENSPISILKLSELSRICEGEVLESFNNLITEVARRYPSRTVIC